MRIYKIVSLSPNDDPHVNFFPAFSTANARSKFISFYPDCAIVSISEVTKDYSSGGFYTESGVEHLKRVLLSSSYGKAETEIICRLVMQLRGS